MGLNEIAVKVGKLEERMDNLERQILGELRDRKEGQATIAQTQERIEAKILGINQKVWVATGFLICLQIVLQVVLKLALK